MLTQKEYRDRLIECRSNHTKFADMQQSLSRKKIVDKLADDFEMVFAFKATCARFPDYSYRDHVKLRVLSKEMFTLDLPSMDQWKTIEKYGRFKYTLHA